MSTPVLPDPELHGPPETQATFTRIRKSRGFVSNLMRSMGHAPEGLQLYMALGHYGRYDTALTERERELAICMTGRNIPHAWAHHAPMAVQAGISEDQMATLKQGRAPAGLPENEAALCAFAVAFGNFGGVPPAEWDALKRHYTPRQCTDIALLCAYFLAAGALIIGMGLEIEPPEVLAQELAWQARPREPDSWVKEG
jgi:hypothetical protein